MKDDVIPLFKVHIPPGAATAVRNVFDSGYIAEGDVTRRFEKAFGEYVGNPHVAVVNSGTSALALAAHMLDVKPGDEVITSPMTCFAMNAPFYHAGATLVWADVDPLTGNIDVAHASSLVTARTVAVVGVHFGGAAFNVQLLRALIPDHVKIVADAAHAVGTVVDNTHVSLLGDYVCFSFQAIKHLTTGDGGAIACQSEEEADRLRRLRWFGLDRRADRAHWSQDIPETGYKYNMNNIAASIGLAQMPFIDAVLEDHRDNAAVFDQSIVNRDAVRHAQLRAPGDSCWLYTLFVADRDRFSTHMAEHGIVANAAHRSNTVYSAFAEFGKAPMGVRTFDKHAVNIPVGWWVGRDDRSRIVAAVNSYAG